MSTSPQETRWMDTAEELAFALLDIERGFDFKDDAGKWLTDAADRITAIHTTPSSRPNIGQHAVEVIRTVADRQRKLQEERHRRQREGKCEAGDAVCPRHARSEITRGKVWCPELGCSWSVDWGHNCPAEAVVEVSDATDSIRVCEQHLLAIRRMKIPDLRVRPFSEDGREIDPPQPAGGRHCKG
jgi:hypothetical protein